MNYGHRSRVGSLLDGGRLDETLRRKFGGDTLRRHILACRKSARHVVLSELFDVFELLLRATQLQLGLLAVEEIDSDAVLPRVGHLHHMIIYDLG